MQGHCLFEKTNEMNECCNELITHVTKRTARRCMYLPKCQWGIFQMDDIQKSSKGT